jgi:signal transduction histidine kinase
LAVVKRIVEEHRGLTRVESSPGVGSTFAVGIPLSTEIHATTKGEET